jgi:hypothetical protein
MQRTLLAGLQQMALRNAMALKVLIQVRTPCMLLQNAAPVATSLPAAAGMPACRLTCTMAPVTSPPLIETFVQARLGGDTSLRLSWEFSHHPWFPVISIKR